jgi:hypothetical protein
MLDHQVFQGVFGSVMTLLIALEFKHSIVRVALRRDSGVQVRTVLLIAPLALSRKFAVLQAEPALWRRWCWVWCTGCCASAMTASLEPDGIE